MNLFRSIKDSIETSKRLIQDINECCLKNRRERERYESLKKSSQHVDEDDDYVKLQYSNELCKSPSTENNSSTSSVNLSGEEDIDIIAKDDELLRKILNRTYHTNSPNLLSPIHPNEEIINLFNIENGNFEDQAEQNKKEPIEEFQFIEQDLSLNPADFEKIICKSTPLNFNQNSSNQANLCKKRLDFELVEVNDLMNELIEKIERQLDLENTSNNCLPTNAEFPTPESTPPVLKQSHREPLFASQLTKSQLSEELYGKNLKNYLGHSRDLIKKMDSSFLKNMELMVISLISLDV
ncbi:hypothetical protein BpHYR1_030073 [Brachionus plicatilis]|uniref:Uncharacterized protein n=1 Tax=Brachionus plicatilis TaxID=10195 RepID=A0A3M7SBA3_BRAPC|nr:hypothetical protein BpHYR1_030073 [Brachionus plicatilis]